MNFSQIIKDLYVERDDKSNKSDNGRVLIIGGSKSFPNAVSLAASFASLAGPGYVSLAVPEDIYFVLATRNPAPFVYVNFKTKSDEFLLKENKEVLDKVLLQYDSILFGNGIFDSQNNYRFLEYIVKNYSGNLIIDATGLKLLADNDSRCLKEKKPVSRILLTPHLGEARRLFHCELISREAEDYLAFAKEYVEQNKVYLLLKSYSSIFINLEKEVYTSNYVPTPSLSKAGSGDGLAGYLAGLLAYGLRKEKFTDLVIFGDQLIHLAAYQAQQHLSAGIASILDVPLYVQKLISEELDDELVI